MPRRTQNIEIIVCPPTDGASAAAIRDAVNEYFAAAAEKRLCLAELPPQERERIIKELIGKLT
ncbi:MAG: hypothetical protein ACI4XA_11005 [Oscillospiraceae bacterium]